MSGTAVKRKKTVSGIQSVTRSRAQSRRESLADARLMEVPTPPAFFEHEHEEPIFQPRPIITSKQIVIKVQSMFLISIGYIIFSIFMFIAGGVVTHWLIHHPENNPLPILSQTNAEIAKKIDEEDFLRLKAEPVAAPDEIFPQTATQQYVVEYASSQDRQSAERMLQQLRTFKVEAELEQQEDEYGRQEYVIHSAPYTSYSEAREALEKAPDPYRSWARIDRLNGSL